MSTGTAAGRFEGEFVGIILNKATGERRNLSIGFVVEPGVGAEADCADLDDIDAPPLFLRCAPGMGPQALVAFIAKLLGQPMPLLRASKADA